MGNNDLQEPRSNLATVERTLVHRRAVSEVFLTGGRRLSEHQFSLDAQWPSRHHYFSIEHGRVDIVLVAETLRQATIFLAHQYYGVGLRDSFLMQRMEVESLALVPARSVGPFDVAIIADVDRVRFANGTASSLRTTVIFTLEGVPIAQGVGYLKVVDRRVYARLRAGAITSDDPRIGNTIGPNESGVTLESVSATTWTVRFDPTHPVFFDHACDHLPGMLIVEAVRQAARVLFDDPAVQLESFSGDFDRFLDLDAPVLLSARVLGDRADGRFAAEVRQKALAVQVAARVGRSGVTELHSTVSARTSAASERT